jgi:signal transduction histidine kinase
LTAETRHNLFLAFEEAISNALRHSGASCVCVDMGQRNGFFEIRIQDNGRGFDSAAKTSATDRESGPARGRKGNGLANMRQRLASVGGEARIESHGGQGTTVTFSLPIKIIPKNIP